MWKSLAQHESKGNSGTQLSIVGVTIDVPIKIDEEQVKKRNQLYYVAETAPWQYM